MYPEDRVLVAYVPRPSDFDHVRREGWYRIPYEYAPKGLHAEYLAFYFGNEFGPEKWAIHYYAPRLGHELARRRDLLPDEPDHPRAEAAYYKVQLGPLQRLERPIVSLRWRRVTFIHTTWDRFQDAAEINDLFIEGGVYVDRLYHALKDKGIQPERNYLVAERGVEYNVALAVPCRTGRVEVTFDRLPASETEVVDLAATIEAEIAGRGGAT